MCNKTFEATLNVNQNSYVHILDLFKRLAEDLKQKNDLCDNNIKMAIDVMNSNFRKVSNGQLPIEIDFNDMNYCVGYLHRFALCHAAMVQKTILFHVLRSPPLELLDKLRPNHNLKIVSIGSGPANDVFGFLSGLHSQCMKLQSLDITVVDKMSGWKAAFTGAMDMLKNNKSGGVLRALFKDGGPDVSSTYLAEDLDADGISADLERKLKNADVVLLVKVLSHVPDQKKLPFLKKIEKCMKLGALLFYIDSLFPSTKFAALTSLECVYEGENKLLKFRFRNYNFGHVSLYACHAATRIFVKK